MRSSAECPIHSGAQLVVPQLAEDVSIVHRNEMEELVFSAAGRRASVSAFPK